MNPTARFCYGAVCLVAFGHLFAVVTIYAMPHLQHLVAGRVQSFDPPTQTLTIVPVCPGLPSSVVISAGRTRLRENGKSATLQQLPATGPVRIYYRTELGQPVATEVSWRTETKVTGR